MKTWLLVDCNYLAWRSYHAIGPLSHEGRSTSVCFGVLRDLEGLLSLHSPDRTILAFDSGSSKRASIFPGYKASRKNKVMSDEERERIRQFYLELGRFQNEILPDAGFRNVIDVPGYEADDILAQVAKDIPTDVTAVIVSADGDLLQCLAERVVIYNPAKKKAVTAESFREQWKISPKDWATVKAIAGCSTDDVPGVPGVGELTAARWVAAVLPSRYKAHAAITESTELIERNLELVRLPFPGCVVPELQDDAVTRESLAKVKSELGIRIQRAGVPVPIESDGGFFN